MFKCWAYFWQLRPGHVGWWWATILLPTPIFNWMYIHEIAHCLTSLVITLNNPPSTIMRLIFVALCEIASSSDENFNLSSLFDSAKFSTCRIDNITTSHRPLYFVLNQFANVSNGSRRYEATNWRHTLHDGNDALQIFELASNFKGKSATV